LARVRTGSVNYKQAWVDNVEAAILREDRRRINNQGDGRDEKPTAGIPWIINGYGKKEQLKIRKNKKKGGGGYIYNGAANLV
jgi:hypothetical protein